MAEARPRRPPGQGAIGVNPDQRMHEDARHLTELSGDLGVQLLQSSILLITFVDVLWALSAAFVFHSRPDILPFPAIWCGRRSFMPARARCLSYWVGGSLIPRNADRYQRESELRYSLMQVNQHIDADRQSDGEARAAAASTAI